MRSTLCALLITLAAAVLITATVRIGQDRADLRSQITALERSLDHHQIMLDDVHRYMGHIRHQVECIDTGLNAHDYLWALAEELERRGHPVAIAVSP